MALEFQGEDIVHGILNERDGVNVSDLTNHPFYLKPPGQLVKPLILYILF